MVGIVAQADAAVKPFETHALPINWQLSCKNAVGSYAKGLEEAARPAVEPYPEPMEG